MSLVYFGRASFFPSPLPSLGRFLLVEVSSKTTGEIRFIDLQVKLQPLKTQSKRLCINNAHGLRTYLPVCWLKALLCVRTRAPIGGVCEWGGRGEEEAVRRGHSWGA